MVLTSETRHVYPFHWDVVTRAFWHKYPNERLAHVECVDVLDRQLDAQGRLMTTRVAKVRQTNVPQWVRSALSDSTYVFEETICDPQLKRLVLRSTNLSLRSVATVEETCVYSVHPDEDQKTLYEAEAKVTAFVPLLGRKLESFSASRGTETAVRGIRVVEEICNDIFQGTFQPAFCTAAAAGVAATDSMAAKTTQEMAVTAANTGLEEYTDTDGQEMDGGTNGDLLTMQCFSPSKEKGAQLDLQLSAPCSTGWMETVFFHAQVTIVATGGVLALDLPTAFS